LRRNWLAILQIAAVLAGIAALARPMLPLASGDVAIILDVSASMSASDGATTRLNLAQTRAASLVDALPSATRVQLVKAGTFPERLGSYLASDAALTQTIRAVAPTAGRADLGAAIEVVRAGSVAEQAIYVFTDRGSGIGDQGSGPDPRSQLQWIPLGRPADNIAITRLAVRRLPTSATQAQALVESWNYGDAALDTSIEVTQDGSVVGRHPIHLRPRQATTLVVDLEEVGDVVSARLQATDALDVDNVRFAVATQAAPIRVLLVRGSFFLDKALSANSELSVQRVSEEPADAIDGSRTAHDVTVCEGCSRLPTGDAAVLIVPRSDGSTLSTAPLMLSLPHHPIAEAVELTGVRAAMVASKAPSTDADVIARALGRPALVAYEQDGRRVVELGFDPARGDAPLSTAFPVLIANIVDWLAARRERALEIAAGETLQWRIGGAQGQEVATVVTPDGRPLPATVAQGHLTFAATEMAGVYRIGTGGRQSLLAVNPVTEGESDLTVSITSAIEPGDNPVPPETVVARRSEIVTPWLLLCLALVTAEWWLRVERGRQA
jgi:hypothetical protein